MKGFDVTYLPGHTPQPQESSQSEAHAQGESNAPVQNGGIESGEEEKIKEEKIQDQVRESLDVSGLEKALDDAGNVEVRAGA